MVDSYLELQRLRATLISRGFDSSTIEQIIEKAHNEIEQAMASHIEASMDQAISIGVQKESADFINELRPAPGAFLLETESSRTDFSDPPYPMLDRLLKNAKPMKDGSGVYKVIPVGEPGSGKRPIYTDITDAQKAIAAERHEAAVDRYNKIKPKNSKANFKTATSKQDRNTQWVMPAKEKDFTQDLKDINSGLQETARDVIERIIRSYEDNF